MSEHGQALTSAERNDGPVTDDHEWLRERFAEVRGEHGWARYVDDEVLAAWLRPAHEPDEPDERVSR